MANLYGLTAIQFETFLLVAVRCTAMLFVLPVFSAKQLPLLVRMGLGILISFVVYRTTPVMKVPLTSVFELAVAILTQVFVGLLVGFVAYLVFMGIQFAGEYMDLQVGFAVVNIINPATQTQVTILGEFTLAMATLIFLITDSHHLLLGGMRGTFDLVPLPNAGYDISVLHALTAYFARALLIVFQIATPVAIALFITNVALALMARVAPQMNVFVVGFPLQIGIGLIMVIVSIPLLGSVVPHLFEEVPREIDTVLRGLGPAR